MPGNTPLRGDIYHIELDEIGNHYAVVVSADAINRNADSVVIAFITSKGTDRTYPHEFLIPSGLMRKPSKVKCHTVATWPKEELTTKKFLASIAPKDMEGLDVALMMALDLWK